jgi:hypothetical protein
VHSDFPKALYIYIYIHTHTYIYCTHSPFVPRLPWLTLCGSWNFLRDTGGVHQTWYSIYYFIITCLIVSDVRSLLLSIQSNKNHILTNETHNRHFPPELVTFLFSVTTPYTTSLILFSYATASISHPIPLSVINCFSHLKLSVCNPSYLSPMVLNVHWQFEFKMDGTELPATDVINCSLCCTNKFQLQYIQGDQKVSVHLMITVQKTRKNILKSVNKLPW